MTEATTPMRGDVSEGRFYAGTVKVFPERDTHVPTFCPWQNATEEELRAVTVQSGGVPLLPRFTVAEMDPERRWAVKKDGELLDAMSFQTGYHRQWEEWYTVVKRQKIEGRADRHYIPAVDQYVRFKVDPKNRLNPSLVRIEPERKPSGRKPDHFVDREGEPIRKPRIDVLVAQWREDPSRLRKEEVLEVRQHLGLETPAPSAHDPSEIEATMNRLLRQLAQGEIDTAEFAELSAQLCGVALAEPPKAKIRKSLKAKVREAPRHVEVPCGRKIDGRGVRWHVQKCADCAQARPQPTPQPPTEAAAPGA